MHFLKYTLLLFFCVLNFESKGQTPHFYYHIPTNAGVMDLYFTNNYKMLFIYTQTELANDFEMNIGCPTTISSIWFRHNNIPPPFVIDNLTITLAHTTLPTPNVFFANNFDSGPGTVVLNEPAFAYNAINGPSGQPEQGWTEIVLTTPFVYNFTDNLLIQLEWSAATTINFYADITGPSNCISSDFNGGTINSLSLPRPMFGVSSNLLTPPQVDFVSSIDTICVGECVDFFDASIYDNCLSYAPTFWDWDFEGATTFNSTDQNPTNICYNNPGLYYVKLLAGNIIGSSTQTLNNFIYVQGLPNFSIGNDTSICIGSSTNLDISFPNSTYLWSTNETTSSINVNSPGVYWVDITDNCGTSRDSLTITNIPPLGIELGPDTLMCLGSSITFDAANPNASGYLWLDDNLNSVGSNNFYNASTAGVFTVEVSNVCETVTDFVTVSYEDCTCRPWIPNSFTPNNDGKNEYYAPVIDCDIVYYKMSIFNKWGELLYYTNDIYQPWDGTHNSKDCTQGTYIYVIEFQANENSILRRNKKTGLLYLIR